MNGTGAGAHTPGPWFTQGIYVMACNPAERLSNSQTIARAFPDHPIVGGDTQANAALIAAAPELLSALEALLADKYLSDPINAERMAAARAAVNKAKGTK